MKTKEEAFLGTYFADFEIGNIVSWNEFEIDSNFNNVSVKKYGAIIKIRIKQIPYTERNVWVADVLPFGKTQTKELYLNVLKKETI